MRLKLNRAAALTLTGTAILATLSQVGGGAAPRSYIEGQDHENNNGEQVKADDLDGVSDPSKLPASDFAPGTKWTPAGWTRSNPKLVAKSSSLTLTKDNSKEEEQEHTMDILTQHYRGVKMDFTLNKDDVKKGNKILIGTIQIVNSKSTQPDSQVDNEILYGTEYNNLQVKDDKNNTLGTVTAEKLDNGEIDLYLNVTTSTNYASDPSASLFWTSAIEENIKRDYSKLNLNSKYDQYLQEYFITPDKIATTKLTLRNIDIRHYDIHYIGSLLDWGEMFINDSSLTYSQPVSQWSYNLKQSITPKAFTQVVKLSGSNFDPNNMWIYTRPSVSIIDADYNLRDEHIDRTSNNTMTDRPHLKLSKVADGQDENTLKSSVPRGEAVYSKQNDGSVLVAYNITPEYEKLSDDFIKKLIENSYYYNVQDPDHKKQIMDNTLDFYHRMDNVSADFNVHIRLNSDMNKPEVLTVTDLTTPNIIHNTAVRNTNGSNFKAELYKFVQVHYLDSSNKDSQVANDSIMGLQNTASNYQLNIPKGYILDTKSGKNKDGTQYKWSVDKKSIAYTFNEDQKINDANPINIYITHGTHNTNDNSGKSTRTIQYTGLPDNLKPKDNVQTVLFKRSGVTDDVSGETTYGDWQPQSGNGHYTAVTSPTFAGYKPDQAVVPDTAATPNKNETVTVNYSKAPQSAKFIVHDDTDNVDLPQYGKTATGLFSDPIEFHPSMADTISQLTNNGYIIGKLDNSHMGNPGHKNGSYVFCYDSNNDNNIQILHVTHKIVPVTPDHPKTPTDVIPDTKQHYPTGVDTNDLNKDVQRSILYKYEDNSQAEPTVIQKAHFDRTVKVDAVTQKIVDNGTWTTKDNYPEVATKSIDGYTPDKTKVGSATPSMTTNQDQTVVYHANDEDAAITYIDDTTGKVLKTDTQKAKYKQTIKFATDPNTQIQTYKDQGYILVSSDWKDGSTYQTDPARNKFTVHLKHGTSTVTPDNPKTPTDIIPGTKQHYPKGVDTNDLNQPQQRQITYTYADSKKQASPTVTQKATFHRTATVDNVTGKTTYTDWTTSDQYPEVKSPTIEGYTPDKSNVSVTKPVLNTKQDVAVVYNPNPEQVDVIAQDNTGKQLSKSTLHGNYNTDYTATTPVIKGYHLIKMPANTHGTYKTHNDPIIYIYAPDSNSVPEQTDGTPKPDKSSYPNDLTPAKRSTKLPETGSTTLASELKSDFINLVHLF